MSPGIFNEYFSTMITLIGMPFALQNPLLVLLKIW